MSPLAGRLALVALVLALPAAAQSPLILESPTPIIGGGTGNFGYAVSAVFDTDGDGVADLLVGAPQEVASPEDAGRAHLYSGATGALLRSFDSTAPRENGSFGYSVSGVPDADGDGFGDVLVSGRQEDGATGGLGRVHLYSGATGASLFDFVSPRPQNPEPAEYGASVAGVPDTDGDGRGDVLIGANREGSLAGRAYLHSGATGALLLDLASPASSTAQFEQYAQAVAGIEDVDGDGRGDLVIGAPFEDGTIPGEGRVYLLSGATGAVLQELVSPTPDASNFSGLFGTAVAGVPDADGDGVPDVLVGAYGEEQGVENSGQAHLFSGATGALLHTLRSPNPEVSGSFGFRVAGVPDVDGDGRGDLLISAHRDDVGGVAEAGRSYLFSGATGALLRTLQSPDLQSTALGNFGQAVAGVSDVDGDGRGDLLVGAPFDPSGTVTLAGRAYLFSGGFGVAVETGTEALGLSLRTAPNPASGVATVTLALDVPQSVTVAVFDMLGREVARLHDGALATGPHPLLFDASRLTTGVYLVRAVTEVGMVMQRVTVVR